MTVALIEPDTADSDSVMRLPPVLDLVWAATLQDRLQDRLNQGRPLSIDATAVERVGTPCLQLLVAAARGAKAGGVAFRIEAGSEEFRSAVVDLGLHEFLPIAMHEVANG